MRTGRASFGAVIASGSTEAETGTADVELEVEYTRWRHALAGAAFVSATGGERTGERYFGSAETNYEFGNGTYWLADASRELDYFGPYAERSVMSAGLGHRMTGADGARLDLKGALGRRLLAPQGSDERDWDTVQRFSGRLRWPLSAASAFEQELLLERGGSHTHIESTTSLHSSLTTAISWRVSYAARYDSDVPAEAVTTDTLTTVAVEYAY